MKYICWFGFAIAQLLLGQDALANEHALSRPPSAHAIASGAQPTSHVGKPRPSAQRPRNRSSQADGSADKRSRPRDDYRSGYVTGLRDGKHGAGQAKQNRRDARAAEKYAIREQAERDARAERIYRSSQFSAPIIIDARACKRRGAHGESIYENCQLAATCNTGTGVATCQPSG